MSIEASTESGKNVAANSPGYNCPPFWANCSRHKCPPEVAVDRPTGRSNEPSPSGWAPNVVVGFTIA